MTRPRSLVGALLLGLCGCQTPPEGWLYVTRVTTTSAVVAWSGHARRLTCQGPTGAAVATEVTRRWRGISTAHLTGLAPGARHRCRLGGGPGTRARSVHFRTAPPPGTRFRFAVVGDSGDHSPEAAKLARRIRAARPEFLLHLGDLAYPKGTLIQLHRRFFRPYRRVLERVPLYSVPGNHDFGSFSGYRMAFAPVDGARAATYAFDWAGAHFLAVSSPDVGSPDAPAARWLVQQLGSIPRSAWRTVFLHEPPYSPGEKFITPGLRGTLATIVQAAHVDLLLAGHDHLYARSEPICDVVPDAAVLAIISGGGGADLTTPRQRRRANFPVVTSRTHFLRVTMSPDAIDIRAIGLDGRSFDRVRRRRGTGPPCRAQGWPKAWEHGAGRAAQVAGPEPGG